MDIQELEKKLLSFGGSRVVTQNGANQPETVDILFNRGRVMEYARLVKKPGEHHRCHMNSLDLVVQKPWTRAYCTGYALTLEDGIWRPHSWVYLKKTKTIWETTTERILYYGVKDFEATRIFTIEWEANINQQLRGAKDAETWKPIAGYEEIYEISDKGSVKRIKPEYNTYVGKILAGGYDTDGYHVVLLYKSGKRRMFKVHRLVAEAFLPNPDSKPQVHHKNSVKFDNRAENLEWVTWPEHVEHTVADNAYNPAKGSDHHNAKLKESQIPEIRKLLAEGKSCTDIALLFAVNSATIGDIKDGKTWKHA
jgi:hypothetical protein